MPVSRKGRGFFKKSEKEKVKLALERKKKKYKREENRAAILESISKKTAENKKKTGEKAKILEQKYNAL